MCVCVRPCVITCHVESLTTTPLSSLLLRVEDDERYFVVVLRRAERIMLFFRKDFFFFSNEEVMSRFTFVSAIIIHGTTYNFTILLSRSNELMMKKSLLTLVYSV